MTAAGKNESRYTELPAPTEPVHRYTDIAFPPYRYVPRLHPHPLSVEGYLSQHRPKYKNFGEQFCYGVDLHNQLYFWEAHEVWEELWKDATFGEKEKNRELSRFLQACIVLSASHFTAHVGRIAIAQEMLRKSEQWFTDKQVETQTITMSDEMGFVLDIVRLQEDIQCLAENLANCTMDGIATIRVQIKMLPVNRK